MWFAPGGLQELPNFRMAAIPDPVAGTSLAIEPLCFHWQGTIHHAGHLRVSLETSQLFPLWVFDYLFQTGTNVNISPLMSTCLVRIWKSFEFRQWSLSLSVRIVDQPGGHGHDRAPNIVSVLSSVPSHFSDFPQLDGHVAGSQKTAKSSHLPSFLVSTLSPPGQDRT